MSSRLFTLLLVAAVVAGCTGGGGSGDGGEQAEQAERAEEDPTTTTGEQGADGYSGHGAGSVSEATLAAYAPPPLDPALRAVVQAKLDLRTPNGELLTNDGGRMFFTWSITGSPQVWRLDGPKGFPVQLTGGEDRTSVVAVVPGGDKIVVSRDRAGTENPGLFLQPADGGPLEVVFDEDGVQASALFVSDDGKALYYRANDRRPESYTFYRYDIATGTSKAVFDEDGTWSVADHKGEGTLLLTKTIGSVDTEIYEFDLATKALVPIVGKGEGEEHFAAYGPGDDEVLVLTPKLGEYRRLYRLTDRVAGELVPITPELDHDVSYFTIDEARRRILYTVNEDGYTRLAAMDAASGTPIALPRLPEADHVYQGATTPNGRYTTVTVETARAPAATYVLDWQNGGLTEWHTVSMPETDPADFAVATLEHYVARDGTEIPMFVRRPPGCDDGGERAVPCPVVVSFHGGPESQAGPGFHPFSQLLVDAGMIVVHPNVRGSNGYGKTWINADNGAKRLEVITDIEDAATSIRNNWAVDGVPPRIGVYGGSYGGYSALLGMTRFAGAYDAGVSVVGMSSLLTFLENTAPYRRKIRSVEYGDPEADRDALVELSPITWIDRLAAPLLLIQGANDPRVPVGEAVQIHEAAQAKGIDSGLIVFPDEGHGVVKRANQVLQYGHVIEFFTRHLGVRG